MKEKIKFIFICMILAANSSFAQKNYILYSKKIPQLKPSFPLSFNFYSPRITQNIIPGNFYSSNLGFFCKKEIRIESVTKIPFKFRLGSLPYCDWLEGKKNASILPQR